MNNLRLENKLVADPCERVRKIEEWNILREQMLDKCICPDIELDKECKQAVTLPQTSGNSEISFITLHTEFKRMIYTRTQYSSQN